MSGRESKNVLIVYAHQEPKSFNGALRDVAVETLKEQGHDVEVSDLYDMRFDPTASKHHFTDMKVRDYFDFQRELRHAVDTDSLPADLQAEVRKIVRADLIILQFPLYWMGLPAILKGWMDRCFAENVAFNTTTGQWFDNGPFKDKKVMLSFTTGASASFFSKRGVFGDMDVILWPIQYTLRFTGLQVLSPQVWYAPVNGNADTKSAMMQLWADRLSNIWDEKPIEFIHVRHFEPENGFELSDKFLENINDDDLGPTVGHNLGKAFPAGSMTKNVGNITDSNQNIEM